MILCVSMLFSSCSKSSINSNYNSVLEVTESTSETSLNSNIVYHNIIESTTETNQEASVKTGDIPSTETVEYYFNLLPDNVKTAFYNDNWTYEKVDYSLGDKYYNGTKQISGITDFDNHIIYIDYRDEVNRSILHEIGHRFEFESRLKGVNSEEFKNLYENHWTEWYTNYGGHINNYKTIKEAYAQCFEIYFISPDCLDSDTYNFILNEISLV